MNKDKEFVTITDRHKVIIRENDKEIRVFVHLMTPDMQEKMPLAYILGFNGLIMKAK